MALTPEQYADIVEAARADGFEGFGGACGAAAVAIRRALFPEGRLVAAVNKAFYEDAGIMIGHVAVEVDGVYYDADGKPKEWEEIESWGMLDFEDGDLADRALDEAVAWNEEAASEPLRIEPDEDDVAGAFGGDRIDAFTDALLAAREAVLDADRAPPGP